MDLKYNFYGLKKVKDLKQGWKIYLINKWWTIIKIDRTDTHTFLNIKAYFKGYVDLKLENNLDILTKF